MFDIGMGELALLAVVGLLVLGPERLPRVARTAGALLRKARQSWQSVQADIERELAADELKQTIKRAAAAVDPTQDLRNAIDAARVDTTVRDPSPGADPSAGTAASDSPVKNARD
jgi:sec-independent protein translocase protein TatB